MDLPMPRSSRTKRQVLAVCLAFQLVLRTQLAVFSQDTIPAHLQSVLDAISANSLRGHLSFIASDLLEGRDSPSRGLDIAAEYIAAQFRRAGLEPVGDAGSYFQTSEWSVGPVNNNYVDLAVDDGKQKIRARADQLAALGVRPG